MFNAKIIDEFITQDECQTLLSFVGSVDVWNSDDTEFWNNRYLNAEEIYNKVDKNIGKILYNIREKIAKEIESQYNIGKIYPDLMQIVRWFPGMEQPPHADDMTNANDEGLDWFAHREFGSIIYLNNDYSGGKTYYPNHNFEVTPKVGRLAIHPGDPEHLHGVTKIENNVRYTLAAFWTKDSKYFDGWTI